MKKNTSRVLALVMALALVLGNFTGLGMTVKAADYPDITKVEVSGTSVPSEGGNVEVKITGTNLPETLYYGFRTKGPDGMGWISDVNKQIQGPGADGGTVSVAVPANTSGATRSIRIGFSYQSSNIASTYVWSSVDTALTQEAAGGSETPTVDKTALNKAIEEAGKCIKSDYTAEAWTELQNALNAAKNVKENSAATETDVKNATNRLNAAIANRKPAADDTAIKAKVVDEQGKPLSGIEFKLKDEATFEELDIPVSDEKGETEYSVEDCYDGDYTLSIHTTAEYTFEPVDGYTYIVANGKVTEVTVDGKDYTEAIPTFTAKKVGSGETDPQEPEADKKTLKVKVVDEVGLPVDDMNCKFAIVDTEYPDNESVKKYPVQGSFTVNKLSQDGAIIRLASTSKDYEVISEPKQFELAIKNGEIQTVNGEAYDGKTEYTFEVKKIGGAEEEKGKITSAVVAPEEFSADGGQATLLVAGEKLNDNLSVVVKLAGQMTDIQPVKSVNSTDTMHTYTIDFPANDTTQAQYYSVQCIVGSSALDNRYIPVTVAGKEEGGEGPTDPESEAKITELSVTPDTIPAKGGAVTLSVEGENLTADNWTAKAVGVLEGTSAIRETVEATDITENSATLMFGKNNIQTNRIKWTIQAGTMIDGEFVPQKEAVVYQDKNIKVETVDITDASQPDGKTIVVTFEKDVKVAELEDAELRKLIHVDRVMEVNGHQATNSEYYLQEGDTVTAKGNVVTIQLGSTLKLTAGASKVYFEQGALMTTVDGKDITVKEASWIVSSNPSVYSIDYEKDVFDYNGGTAVAVLSGVRLNELDLNDPDQFEATISNPQTQEVYNFPMTITPGEKPTISFDVPKNETESTQSYLLSLKVNGSPVYEATSANKAKRAIVSVLAKGTDPSEQTLSSLTISGNNKMEGSTSTDITVDVEAALGQLKIELKLSGTNLDSKLTEARAIDENGVIWPVSHVPE